MSQSYPIWNDVTACIYKSSKSWGARQAASVQVRVGSSAQNSHAFLLHETTHREHANGDREFRFYVNKECIRRAILHKGAPALMFVDPDAKYHPDPVVMFSAARAAELEPCAIRLPHDADGNPRYYFSAALFKRRDGTKFRPLGASAYRGKQHPAGWVLRSYNLNAALRDAFAAAEAGE